MTSPAAQPRAKAAKDPSDERAPDEVASPRLAAKRGAVAEEVEAERSDSSDESPAATAAPARLLLTGYLTAGMIVSGNAAPTTGAKLTVATPLPQLRALELGGSLGLGRLWRADAMHSASLVQLTAAAAYGVDASWGRLSVGAELGASYFSSLDYSTGVIPGTTTAAKWVFLSRVEAGVERPLTDDLSLRVAAGLGVSPRSAPLLASVAEATFLLGLRYAR